MSKLILNHIGPITEVDFNNQRRSSQVIGKGLSPQEAILGLIKAAPTKEAELFQELEPHYQKASPERIINEYILNFDLHEEDSLKLTSVFADMYFEESSKKGLYKFDKRPCDSIRISVFCETPDEIEAILEKAALAHSLSINQKSFNVLEHEMELLNRMQLYYFVVLEKGSERTTNQKLSA